MNVPERYDTQLEPIIDQHTHAGILPGAFVLHWLQIQDDFQSFFHEEALQGESILIIGGRSNPIQALQLTNVKVFEPRPRYRSFIKPQYALQDSDLEACIETAKAVIVMADYLAEQGHSHPALISLNCRLNHHQKFFVVNYQWEKWHSVTRCLSDDGFWLDVLCYRHWLDRNRSHMHLGFRQIEKGTLRIKDLSYTYPVNV